jgi:hypothetical protein
VGALDGGIAGGGDRFRLFTGGIWAWAPVWLPELFPTRLRGTAIAFCFNAPRWVSSIGPLIAGTLIVGLGGYGPAATLVGLFFLVGIAVARDARPPATRHAGPRGRSGGGLGTNRLTPVQPRPAALAPGGPPLM